MVIQRVPNYTDVTFSGSGVLTASDWEALATTPTGGVGYLTGIVAFRANGTVTVASGTSITVVGKVSRRCRRCSTEITPPTRENLMVEPDQTQHQPILAQVEEAVLVLQVMLVVVVEAMR